ncbi:MAG: dihydrodipicolinate synthase family protein [Planctomycetaceae bacterium]|nr:dihydrodipicolinate synthase family protein [Planctomycetaceae bacterium]
MSLPDNVRQVLNRGVVIPASPLALDEQRQFDERYQRAVWRYYGAAGAGGIAVGVHTTQFAIRDPKIGLYRPLLALAKEVFDELDQARSEPMIRVAGICGRTDEAVAEASYAAEQGFHTGLLNLSAMRQADDIQLAEHCREVSKVLPVFGFYLQASVGGRPLPYSFWRRFAEVENVAAVKIAAFNRYQTIDVVRALAEAGRNDVALYTGNDDNILMDLVTPFRFMAGGKPVERRFVGGLLGHWAVWTQSAVDLLARCHLAVADGGAVSPDLLAANVAVTDMNAALFDVANQFAGCIPGVHEILRRQGLLPGTWCLNPEENLSPGQSEELDRVSRAYPDLVDDEFVAENLTEWLA